MDGRTDGLLMAIKYALHSIQRIKTLYRCACCKCSNFTGWLLGLLHLMQANARTYLQCWTGCYVKQSILEGVAYCSSGLGPKTGPGIFQLGQPTQTIWTRVLLLIRLPTSICWKALSFTAAIFFTRLLSYTSTPRSGRPSNVYHRVGRRVYSNSFIQHAPNPSANFYRVKKCKIWPRSSTPLFFWAALISKRSNA